MYIASHETGFHSRMGGEPLPQYKEKFLSLVTGLAEPIVEDNGLKGIGSFVEGRDVILDGGFQNTGSSGGAPSNHMYFLNTNYIHFRPHKDRNMVPLEPDRFAVNQDAMVKLIAFAGNLTASNCSLQGVLKD